MKAQSRCDIAFRGILVSSAVLKKKCRGIVIALLHHAKTLTFSNISFITEDIYLKLRLFVNYQKGNPSGRVGNPQIFFQLRIFT